MLLTWTMMSEAHLSVYLLEFCNNIRCFFFRSFPWWKPLQALCTLRLFYMGICYILHCVALCWRCIYEMAFQMNFSSSGGECMPSYRQPTFGRMRTKHVPNRPSATPIKESALSLRWIDLSCVHWLNILNIWLILMAMTNRVKYNSN